MRTCASECSLSIHFPCLLRVPAVQRFTLDRYPFPKNPKNWPAEEEFSSSVLLNQGTDCVSKAAAMEYRVRRPLEHVEVPSLHKHLVFLVMFHQIRVIDDITNPCNGARGLFARTKIPKGRLVHERLRIVRWLLSVVSHASSGLHLHRPLQTTNVRYMYPSKHTLARSAFADLSSLCPSEIASAITFSILI
jgi:hypothetical protein